MKRILIVQGQPDNSRQHFCHALADSYASAATEAGHQVQIINVADSGTTCLYSREEWEDSSLPAYADEAQNAIASADHIVFIYPLWLGSMPALLKAWLEQVFRKRFAFTMSKRWLAPKTERKVGSCHRHHGNACICL